MDNRRIQPSPPLRDIVESIWLQEGPGHDGLGEPACVLPTGTVEILFHYGDRFSHVEPDRVTVVPRSYVTGQRSRPVFPRPTGRVGIVLVSLFPWGLSSLFPEGADTLDGYVDLALLLGQSRISELEERLLSADGSAHRIRLVESFLLALRGEGAGDTRMIAAARRLASATAPRSVRDIAGELSMSRRHFARLFRATIGLQPKTFSRVMRFQRAMRLRRGGNVPWAGIAAECGYADQAHLAHEFKRFAARTPKGIEIQPEGPDEFFNGRDVSKFFNTIYL